MPVGPMGSEQRSASHSISGQSPNQKRLGYASQDGYRRSESTVASSNHVSPISWLRESSEDSDGPVSPSGPYHYIKSQPSRGEHQKYPSRVPTKYPQGLPRVSSNLGFSSGDSSSDTSVVHFIAAAPSVRVGTPRKVAMGPPRKHMKSKKATRSKAPQSSWSWCCCCKKRSVSTKQPVVTAKYTETDGLLRRHEQDDSPYYFAAQTRV